MPIGSAIKRLAAPFRKDRLDRNLNEEIQFHLEMETAENIRKGMAPEEARFAALRSFGGVEQAKEHYRRLSAFGWLEDLVRDVRHAARSLVRNPGYTLLAILSLSLGIGANTAVFTMIRALILQPLPYPEPARLFHLYESMTWQGQQTWGAAVSVPNLADWRRDNSVFDSIGAFNMAGVNLSTGDGVSMVAAAQVDGEIGKVLGVKPFRGRMIEPGDCVRGRPPAVVLSHGLWADLFGSDLETVGKSVRLNGTSATVVGIMPETFEFPPRTRTRAWVPLVYRQEQLEERGTHWLRVIGRLKPGISALDAQADMNRVARRLEEIHPDNATRGIRISPVRIDSVRETGRAMTVLTGAVMFILVLACVNVAILTLARAAARRRELAVRLSMGASWLGIARLLVGEALLLAAGGGLFGLLIADWSLRALEAAPYNPWRYESGFILDSSTLIYCLIASAVSAGFAGLWPALRLSRLNLQTALKEGASTNLNSGPPPRSKLMIAEIALALLLVLGATLLMKSLGRLATVDLGFQTENVVTMRIALPEARYEPSETAGFFGRFLEQVERLPGISRAGVINVLPITPINMNMSLTIEGRPLDRPGHEPAAEHRTVSPGYFHAMGITALRGRHLTANDWNNRTNAVLINRQMAERYFPGQDPVGKRIARGTEPAPDSWLTIAGVVNGVRDTGLYRPVPTAIYEPMTQFDRNPSAVSLVVRTNLTPESVEAAVRGELRQMESDAVAYMVRTMDKVVEEATSGTRFLALLLSLFAGLAVLLAVAGVYGVTSFQTARRNHEIGVRAALGATRAGILRMILSRTMSQALTGIVVGLACALSLNRVIRNYTIGEGAVDAIAYLEVAAVVGAIAMVAGFVPAWRASRIHPIDALREE
ncbi:MAG TPA: ABC transporter permease [Bryobacteraceae bacterium]|nr:ABC transporter permease [Bryobacteraceae bacterium]